MEQMAPTAVQELRTSARAPVGGDHSDSSAHIAGRENRIWESDREVDRHAPSTLRRCRGGFVEGCPAPPPWRGAGSRGRTQPRTVHVRPLHLANDREL